ncbi:MAG: bifunctional DedA family/phosphatase PAP2 family protein [Patescibacteria group bacterium]|nr:bifunctional DedA family/phosphatase PAP2 family protein [Patescibacteria group bacterium]
MQYTQFFAQFVHIIEVGATHGGYVFLFIISIVEAIPFIGSFVPGHTAVIISGFLARVGVFNLYYVITLASLGAVIGDMIGFYMGRRYGMRLIDRLKPYLFIKDEHIAKTKAMVTKHTGKALILGRFNPITRPLMPFIVGTSDSDIVRFWIFNMIGGILWASASVLLGYVFGLGYHAAAGIFGRMLLIATLVIILIVWGYHFVNVRFHIFRKYELFALGLNLISLWALAKTIGDAWASASFMANFDIAMNIFMNDHAPQIAIAFSKFIGIVANVPVIIAFGGVVAVVLAFRRYWRESVLFVLSLASTGFVLGLMKEFFLRVRPDNALVYLSDPSFPSGHSAIAAALFVIVAYCLAFRISNVHYRETAIALCVLVVFSIGVSRLIINVHWASDVVAGWSLGVFCATASILLVRYVGALLVPKSARVV